MVFVEFAILILVSWKSMVNCIQIDRITDGVDITPPRRSIYGSVDLFTNEQLYDKDCTKRNSVCMIEGCREKTCCRCKCNTGLTFFSHLYGCLTAEEIRLKSGQRCRYIFYNQTIPVIPAFRDKSNAEGVRIDVRLNGLPQLISLEEMHTTCIAGSVNEITSTGSTRLLDPNHNMGIFEIQHVYHPSGGYKGLTFNGWTYELWSKLEGRLISLEISCFNQSETLKVSSCLLFKVNGTIDSSSTHTELLPTSPTKQPKIKESNTSTRGTTKLPIYGTSTEQLVNNATFGPVTINKGSGSVAPIVGGIVGSFIFLCIIFAIWFFCKKRRRQHVNGNKANFPEVENGNSIPAHSSDNAAEQPLTQTSENPYYDASATQATQNNEYFDPKVVIKSNTNNDGCDVYYSTADALKNQTQSERPFEYSYARGTAKGSDISSQEHYQPLSQSKYNPEMYQSLDAAKGAGVNEDARVEENPYYTPSTETDSLLEDNVSQEKKGLSLKNNAGSRENVAPTYEIIVPGSEDTTVYQGLTSPSKQKECDPLQEVEYQDMSFGDKSDGEYMYAST